MKPSRYHSPNPNSKTQLQKQEEKIKNPTKFVECCKCGIKNITLYKTIIENKYLCKNCYEKGIKNGK